jgi:hypothetical protein
MMEKAPLTEPTLEETRNWVASLMIRCPMRKPVEGCPAVMSALRHSRMLERGIRIGALRV